MSRSMRLGELFLEAGLPLPPERFCDVEVLGISADSRTVREGELFVAISGFSQDGAEFAAEAVAKGACFLVSQKAIDFENITVVPNARETLSRLLDAWYGHPAKQMQLIGVTGTNGKTSSATMLYHILQSAGYSVGLIGTVECRCNTEVIEVARPVEVANMTTPDPAQLYALLDEMRRRGVFYVVMEVTSHALALQKVEPLFFKRAVFTNLTADHLDMHGDMERYFLEKSKLFGKCEEAVICTRDPYGRRLANAMRRQVFEVNDEKVFGVQLKGARGVSYMLSLPSGDIARVELPVPGQFSVENSALALTCALSLGVPVETALAALSCFPGVKGRMERVECADLGIVALLDYAHTPDALEKLLRAVRELTPPCGRVILLFGCGGDRDRTKRSEMGRVASSLADLVVITSDNCRGEEPREIIRQILRGIDKERPHIVIEDREKAILYAIDTARRGDTVVLAGKGHEEYEIKGNRRLPFCERSIVERAFAKRKEAGYEN